ncbi:class I SAM-dependent methyltransferase [Geomonas subterranea]|uniref:Class I SAM-dependent methyltransferase n=1 Tax=Geomonas subterranea TaxID=2847989 RepID=A0ABX8LMW3_9BACT|nr:class I SAM-dependent methyltransferase [Geomonas subterranea]QXE92666.1 class I SAM-dependent methyltransferase [Geomonas subterranea]QXM09235.1 class I SAM-dependent methyltransferase [Geomonas subterranea]
MLTQAEAWDQVITSRRYGLESPDEIVVKSIDRFKGMGVKRVIDVGCGLGRHVALFAEHGFSVLGLDISANAVATSLEQVTAYPGAHVIAGDATRMEVASDSFDLALAWRMIHLGQTNQIDVMLREINRVLRPGGALFCSVRSTSNALYPKARAQGREIEQDTFVMGSEGLDGLVYHFFTREEILWRFSEHFEIEAMEERELEHTSYTSERDTCGNWFWIVLCRRRN